MVVSLVTFVTGVPSEDSNLQNKNRILVENSNIKDVSLAGDKLVWWTENGDNLNKINIGLDSLNVTINTHGHQLLKMQSEPPVTLVNEMVEIEEDDSSSEDSEDDSDSDSQSTKDEGLLEIEEHVDSETTQVEETSAELVLPVEEVIIEEPQIDQSVALLEIENPQEDYSGVIVQLTDTDRDILGRLVMGEAGNQGYKGAALVAQCIRDTMVFDGVPTVEQVRVDYKYSGSLDLPPNQDVLNAIDYIFDKGGMAVKHRVQYFYAPRLCTANWHETQVFVIEHGGHRFFAKR